MGRVTQDWWGVGAGGVLVVVATGNTERSEVGQKKA